MTVDTQELLATRGSIAPLSPPRLQEIRDRAFRRIDDRATRGRHIHITANEAIELVAAAQALNDAQAKFDAQAAEIERLREALRWTAGALQSACQSAYCSAEGDRVTIGDETKTVSKILDYADAALSGEPT